MEALKDRKKVTLPDEAVLLFRNDLAKTGFEVKVGQSKFMLFFHFPDPVKTGINKQLVINLNKKVSDVFTSEILDKKVWIAVAEESIHTSFSDARHLTSMIQEELKKQISKKVKFYSFR